MDSKARAYRALGKVQRFLPEVTVNILRAELTKEIEGALAEAGVPTALLDPAAKAVVEAHSAAIEILMDERTPWEDRLVKSKAIILPHYRGVGK